MTMPVEPNASASVDKSDRLRAYDGLVKSEAKKALEPTEPVHTTRPPYVAVAALLLSLSGFGYIWLGEPAWLYDSASTVESAESAQAGLRFGLYLTAKRLEEYRRSAGRLPATIAEAGSTEDGIRYVRKSDSSFEISGWKGDLGLTLLSSQSPEALLAPSRKILEQPHP